MEEVVWCDCVADKLKLRGEVRGLSVPERPGRQRRPDENRRVREIRRLQYHVGRSMCSHCRNERTRKIGEQPEYDARSKMSWQMGNCHFVQMGDPEHDSGNQQREHDAMMFLDGLLHVATKGCLFDNGSADRNRD